MKFFVFRDMPPIEMHPAQIRLQVVTVFLDGCHLSLFDMLISFWVTETL